MLESGLCLKTGEGKASPASDERKRGQWATLERGAARATQPFGRFQTQPSGRTWILALIALLLLILLWPVHQVHAAPLAAEPAAAGLGIRGVRVIKPDRVQIRFSRELENADPANFRFTEANAPDIPMAIGEVRRGPDHRVTLVVGQGVDPSAHYRLEVREPPLRRDVRPSAWALFLAVVLSSALINNFVFTRYLGLCIFFGVSKKRETAVGMGVTFTAVMVATGTLSWLLYEFVMKPLQLRFLQVLVFIGIVAFLVQLLDTVLKKTHHALHEKFGIYLVIITTNCIILAVPLLNAAADASGLESFALALGSGAGFALALFLMSCARERLELARVPACFEGLPIAFALTGLFALAFMGFSGLSLFG
jgi:electron transport complex protein RnfA